MIIFQSGIFRRDLFLSPHTLPKYSHHNQQKTRQISVGYPFVPCNRYPITNGSKNGSSPATWENANETKPTGLRCYLVGLSNTRRVIYSLKIASTLTRNNFESTFLGILTTSTLTNTILEGVQQLGISRAQHASVAF